MDPIVSLIVVAGWVSLGLFVGLWMVRRGHDPRWTVIAVVLGPVFVPIALELVERVPRLAASGPDALGEREDQAVTGPRVLVGLDGSAESRRALTQAMDLLGERCSLLMLAEVVSYDATERDAQSEIEAAAERLAVSAAEVGETGVDVQFEVLAGPPGEALRRFADDQGMDLLVVGRRGCGLTSHLLGSVSGDLVRRSHLPVLVVDPTSPLPTAPEAERSPQTV
ncbi:hypothetical protein GCM10009641_77340 [Mycobacterium cookii]|uniref:UspA domain-containing protein n=1 Tax=Nocardioides furvisabuli TaxID=375542 RepID=A0ABN2XFA6_9ACTN|nr:universal stress protein [Nocardioides furvisabuli]